VLEIIESSVREPLQTEGTTFDRRRRVSKSSTMLDALCDVGIRYDRVCFKFECVKKELTNNKSLTLRRGDISLSSLGRELRLCFQPNDKTQRR